MLSFYLNGHKNRGWVAYLDSGCLLEKSFQKGGWWSRDQRRDRQGHSRPWWAVTSAISLVISYVSSRPPEMLLQGEIGTPIHWKPFRWEEDLSLRLFTRCCPTLRGPLGLFLLWPGLRGPGGSESRFPAALSGGPRTLAQSSRDICAVVLCVCLFIEHFSVFWNVVEEEKHTHPRTSLLWSAVCELFLVWGVLELSLKLW